MTRSLPLLVALAACVTSQTGTDPAVDPTSPTSPGTELPGTTPPDEPELPSTPGECTEDYADDLFERYIEPLVSGGQPSSCNSCHLSGLDLSLFVQDTPCQSMACMVELGIVDLEEPESSEVLSWILRAEPESGLITEDVVQQEYDGFLQWIEWSSVCHDAACGEIVDPCNSGTGAGPDEPVPTPLGDCSEADLGARFETQVYAWRDRCAGCHEYNAPYNDGTAPEWIDSGADWNAVLATMYNAIGRGMLDTADPAQSLLILKPLAEDLGGIYHGGGTKIDDWDSPTTQDFLAFAEYWADCQSE